MQDNLWDKVREHILYKSTHSISAYTFYIREHILCRTTSGTMMRTVIDSPAAKTPSTGPSEPKGGGEKGGREVETEEEHICLKGRSWCAATSLWNWSCSWMTAEGVKGRRR